MGAQRMFEFDCFLGFGPRPNGDLFRHADFFSFQVIANEIKNKEPMIAGNQPQKSLAHCLRLNDYMV
jgi:hypothetical protein